MNTTPALSHKDAVVVLHAIKGELERREKGAAVAIVDDHGELLAFVRTDGCRLPSINIAMNKAYTAAREQDESGVVGGRSRAEGFPMTNYGELRYVSWGGGFPLIADGRVVIAGRGPAARRGWSCPSAAGPRSRSAPGWPRRRSRAALVAPG